MNERMLELYRQAQVPHTVIDPSNNMPYETTTFSAEKFSELMIVEFMDVVKTTANELNEHYFRQGCSEEEVMMRVNGALAVLGHIRERFKD